MTTSSFVFESAAQAAARFSGTEVGPIYSRFTNPTVRIFEKRLAAMEESEDCIASASGMAAIAMLFLGTLKQGDHIVATRNMFGSTVNFFKNFLPRYGIEVSWADGVEPEQWASLANPSTRYFYVETPTNPLTELADIPALSDAAKGVGAQLVVDNCFCTPALQQPLKQGADIVIHSATKFLDGQGRCMGGAVLGSHELIETLTSYMRSAGPSMSPFNAWVFAKGLETLHLRMAQHSSNAEAVATWLEQQPAVAKVHYPGLASHPQHTLAKKQQYRFGAVLSFEINGGKDAAWQLIDATALCSITGNLGDSRTTITHPATTTHARISQEDRTASGVTDGLIRLSVGLEDAQDIKDDIQQAIAAINA
jgi:O-succinylhomoserine sulfhydrylase